MKQIFDGVYIKNRMILTENSCKGFRVYGEKLIHEGKKEYRVWDPFRSKLAAAISNGLKNLPITGNSSVLYLGASSGTTPSHIADIAKTVYCVEVSKRMMRELIEVAERKKNMIPILADASKPQEYSNKITSVDFIYQDVAQPNQADILMKNSVLFNPRHSILAIKARSINVVKNPKDVFKEEVKKLSNYRVVENIRLQPFHKDHMLLSLKYGL